MIVPPKLGTQSLNGNGTGALSRIVPFLCFQMVSARQIDACHLAPRRRLTGYAKRRKEWLEGDSEWYAFCQLDTAGLAAVFMFERRDLIARNEPGDKRRI